MALRDLFVMKSPQQQVKDSERFEKSIFPFGNEEREMIAEKLTHIHNRRLNDKTLMYDFITLKQALKLSDESEKDYAEWFYALNVNPLTLEEKMYIKALAVLESEIEDLSQFPTDEQLAEKAALLMNDPVPEKRHKSLLKL